MSEPNKIDLSGDGGVLKEIINEGSGDDHPTPGCLVSVHYTGRLTDGTVFDSSVDRGQPFEFDLGKAHVIRAFEMGAATMKKGEKAFLTCAPEYAYGEAGSPPSVPPNATLIFEIEMLGWRGEDLSPNNDGSIQRYILKLTEKRRTPHEGVLVNVHLTGKYEGRVFEDRVVAFNLGEGSDSNVIEGVEIALEKISLGEISRLVIQSKYAFGKKGKKEFGIPPNATVEYTVKLIDFEKGIDEWKLSDEERIELAQMTKERGTTYFKKGNFPLALKMYKKCINVIENIKDGIDDLKIAGYSNIALCHQKMLEEFEAVQACNEVLKMDPQNIKALYRRGQCSLAVNDFEQALGDFQKVIQLEPANKAAQNQIQICKQKIKESKEREKKIYANMFSKLAVNDNQPIDTSDSDVLDQCGEWNEDEARREADLAFERDNNIVMI